MSRKGEAMKKFLVVLIIVAVLTFAVPFISLISDSNKGSGGKESDEIVTIFSGEDNKS